jgi:hypothetical protein
MTVDVNVLPMMGDAGPRIGEPRRTFVDRATPDRKVAPHSVAPEAVDTQAIFPMVRQVAIGLPPVRHGRRDRRLCRQRRGNRVDG